MTRVPTSTSRHRLMTRPFCEYAAIVLHTLLSVLPIMVLLVCLLCPPALGVLSRGLESIRPSAGAPAVSRAWWWSVSASASAAQPAPFMITLPSFELHQ